MAPSNKHDGKHDGDGAPTESGRRRAQRGLPLLPLRDIIVFPYMVVPLFARPLAPPRVVLTPAPVESAVATTIVPAVKSSLYEWPVSVPVLP